MTCRTVRRAIQGVGAGVTSGSLPAEASQHVSGCAECADLLRREFELTKRLRAAGSAVSLPAVVDSRMRDALRTLPGAKRSAIPIPAMALAASLLVVAVGAWAWWTSARTAPDGSPPAAPTSVVFVEETVQPDVSHATLVSPPQTEVPAAEREPQATAAVRAPSAPARPRRPQGVPAYTARPAVSAPVAPATDAPLVGGGWGADGPAPDRLGLDTATMGRGLDVSASALATEVRLDALSVDGSVSSAAAAGRSQGMDLDVPASSVPGGGAV